MVPAADDDAREIKTVGALFNETVAVRHAGRWKDAADGFDAVLARLDCDSERDRELGLRAMFLKANSLHEQGDAQRTLAACDELLASYGSRDDQKATGFIADTLWLKSRALGRLGDVQLERGVLRHLIEQYRDEPRARSQVARAMYNEGIYLRTEGRGDEAVQTWDELFVRFTAEPPESFPFTHIRGQLAKSQYLAETNRLDAALVTCDRMLAECARLGLPDDRVAEVRRTAQQCVRIARRSTGLSGRLRSLVKRG